MENENIKLELAEPTYTKENLVVQANELIRAKQESLTLMEIKVVKLAISEVLKEATDFQTYVIDAVKLADFLGVSRQDIYQLMDKLTDGLLKKLIRIPLESSNKNLASKKEGDYDKFQWVTDAKYKNGVLYLQLHYKLKPYLLGLNQLFTQYSYEEILKLPTPSSIRLYELLASYQNMQFSERANDTYKNIPIDRDEVLFDIEYLKRYFDCESKYKNNGDFLKWVIEPSVKAIQQNTIMGLSFRKVKTGNKISYLVFKLGTWTEEQGHRIYEELKDKNEKLYND